MCFGKRGSTASSFSSSSSGDLPNARLLDVPTVRRLNSPRCAATGFAYNPAATAASDAVNTRTSKPDEQHKTGDASNTHIVKPDDKTKKCESTQQSSVCALLT